ncbi:MAG TPA: site-2 protease family protein [Methylovirgula sp.]|nr:site-2 protease family protein [Methylovirgula sp.]
MWIDASWLLLAALISWSLAQSVFPGVVPHLPPATYWWMAVAATIGFLFSIIFHEMSHSLVARHYGMPIRGITLFIFGGVAEMGGEPPSAKSEFLMAAAGPAASFVLSAVFFLLLWLGEAWRVPAALKGTLWYLGFINSLLASFNLVPAFPLDGGRMLRAALWQWRKDLLWATRIASRAGDLFGILLIVLGAFSIITGHFVSGMWRFLIGMFLRGAASASYQQVVARTTLEGMPVSRVMTPQPISVSPDLTLDSFIEDYVYRYHHRSFPVTTDGTLIGSVGTEQVAQIDRADWTATKVGQIMIRHEREDQVAPGSDALAALAQMQRTGKSRLWVVEQNKLVGILSLRDVMQLLSTKLQLEQSQHAAAPTAKP